VKRFVERFQLWIREWAVDVEDRFVAWWLLLMVLFVGGDLYTLFTTHQLHWISALSTVLVVAFFILYMRRSRWAWLIMLVFGVFFIVSAPLAYTSAPPHATTGVRLISAAFMLIVGIAALIYSLAIRNRFARDHPTI
jgi:hypothetical protein